MKQAIIPFYTPSDRVLVRSKGCYVYDSDGKEYIDFESGVWCTNLGHCNESISKLMKSQLYTSVHHGYHFRNEHAEELSEKLLRLTGFDEGASVFLSSGSEAINLAIVVARHVTGRPKIVKIESSFLSAYGFGQASPENEVAVTIALNDTAAIDQLQLDEVAAFVLETGGASYDMVRFPSKDFIKRLATRAKEHGCLVIADEVTTGLGRTGRWFGFQHYEVTPDMVVTGKALGNGYPISGITVSEPLAAALAKNTFRHAQSHQNDPLGCSIGAKVLDMMEEFNLVDISQKMGTCLKEQLEQLRTKYPTKIREVRARGLMLAVELTPEVDGDAIGRQLFDEGIVVGCKQNTLRLMPPLVITTTEINRLTHVLGQLLKAL